MSDQLFEVFGFDEHGESHLNGEIVSIVGELKKGETARCECANRGAIHYDDVWEISASRDCSWCKKKTSSIGKEFLRPINNPELGKVDQSINKIVEGVFA